MQNTGNTRDDADPPGWFRLYAGLPHDARLAVVARRAQLTRAEALALYVLVIDYGAQAEPRGTLAGFDAEEAAVALDIPPEKITAALQAMEAKKLIDAEGRATGLQEQPRTSTHRVRAYRIRQRMAKAARRERNAEARRLRLTQALPTGGPHERHE